jgi:hypothetical protein
VPPKSLWGTFAIILGAVLFLGYFFNVGGFATASNALFSGPSTSSSTKINALSEMALPLAGLVVAAFLVLQFVRWSVYGSKGFQTTSKLTRRPVITLEQFKRVAGDRGIDPSVAIRAYQLLLPFYQRRKRARMDERLVQDLRMSNSQVKDMFANLLRHTGGKARPATAEELPVTVLQMLQTAQRSASGLPDNVHNHSVSSVVSTLGSSPRATREMAGEMMKATA